MSNIIVCPKCGKETYCYAIVKRPQDYYKQRIMKCPACKNEELHLNNDVGTLR